ncbi:M23 family metallopeptidase [Leekyejoonella antrihumi]|uniref:M23ase beta-sheet core domain-containing protein n=1 Tax=Leekyejoonella antrihumi TaxID=1660198 RepID=A0A563DZ66_9MICO|nr:M23 family metallopeptidase [Leekyejoonella antrihumi]TWP35291.1 hypothetical protein FGL98_14310 [Leekyejoonella antrihumi]
MRGQFSSKVRVAATVVVAATLFSCTAVAVADDPGAHKSKVDKSIVATQQDLDETTVALTNAASALTKTDTAVAGARVTLTKKQGALTTSLNYQKGVASQLTAARAAENKSQTVLTANATAQTKTRVLVGGVARASYMAGGLGKLELTLELLTSNKNVTDEMSLADIVMRQQNGVLNELGSQQATEKAANSRLTAARIRVGMLKVAADNAVTAATTARNNAKAAQTRLTNLQTTQRKQTSALAVQKTAELKTLKAEKAESARLLKVLQARAVARAKAAHRSALTASAASPRFLPVNDSHFLASPGPVSSITSGFGWRMHPILHIMMLHAGVDFPFPCGTPVYAAAAGLVVEATGGGPGGNHVVIDHGYVHGVNLATEYEHLSRFVVHGGHVAKGQLIAYSGTTGRSTGCHLHFATLENGRYVNPLRWIG